MTILHYDYVITIAFLSTMPPRKARKTKTSATTKLKNVEPEIEVEEGHPEASTSTDIPQSVAEVVNDVATAVNDQADVVMHSLGETASTVAEAASEFVDAMSGVKGTETPSAPAGETAPKKASMTSEERKKKLEELNRRMVCQICLPEHCYSPVIPSVNQVKRIVML